MIWSAYYMYMYNETIRVLLKQKVTSESVNRDKTIYIWAAAWQNQQIDVRTVRTLIGLGIRPVSSESSLSAWRKLVSLATQWMPSKDSDQTNGMQWLPNGNLHVPLFQFKGCSALSFET